MVKVVVGTKVCSFEKMLEEYSRVCEENEKLKSLIEEKNKKNASDKNFAKECSEFSNKCIELQHINHELKVRISELETENKELKDKMHKLEVELAEKNAWFKIRKGLYEKEPLPFSDEEYERYYDDRHQQDCITINQLQTTIDTLVDRYAKLRKMKGL